jgi:hypothetical protein
MYANLLCYLSICLQVLAVLEAMGGSLKSEDEALALQQEEAAKKGSGIYCILYTLYPMQFTVLYITMYFIQYYIPYTVYYLHYTPCSSYYYTHHTYATYCIVYDILQ